jgi:hypothetical protein
VAHFEVSGSNLGFRFDFRELLHAFVSFRTYYPWSISILTICMLFSWKSVVEYVKKRKVKTEKNEGDLRRAFTLNIVQHFLLRSSNDLFSVRSGDLQILSRIYCTQNMLKSSNYTVSQRIQPSIFQLI